MFLSFRRSSSATLPSLPSYFSFWHLLSCRKSPDSMLNNFRCSWSYGLWHISVSCISNILFTIFRFRFSSIFLCYPLYEKHPPIRGRFFIYLSFILTHLMLMQVFFSGCKTTSDMPLLLIHIQNLSDFTGQSRI